MIEAPKDAVATPKVAIDWYRSTPWWRLASQSLCVAWRASHLALCSVALLATHLVFTVTAWLIAPENVPNSGNFIGIVSSNETSFFGASGVGATPMSVWQAYCSPLFQWLESPDLRRSAYCLLNTIALVAIWSFVGGCIARRSIVELGTRATAPWGETIRFVLKRWQSIAWAVTMPLGLIAVLCLLPLIVGWISNIPWVGPWIAGLLMIPIVILSVGIGWCASVTLFGFPLSVCAVVAEKQADAFDGVSRSAAYTFQRPLTFVLCVIGAQTLGMIGGALIYAVLTTGFKIVESAFKIGSSYDSLAMQTWFDPILTGLTPLVIASFAFSFFWTAFAAIYLILRRDVDHAEFDLIDMGSVGEPQPLPPLPGKETESAESDKPKGDDNHGEATAS